MDGLDEQLQTLCADRCGRAVTITDLRRFSGGASRETWSFVCDDGQRQRRLVLRRDPPSAPQQGDRRSEVVLLERAAEAGVPVPAVVWTFDASELGSAGFIMEHVEGETIARKILRDDAFAQARPRLAGQCGETLAKLHTITTDDLFDGPPADARATVDQYANLLTSLGQPHPAFEVALRWLERDVPSPDRPALVHGDFRNGNFIVGPEGMRAVLDWELAHAGDRWEDLAWLCTRSWRFGEAGEVGGFGDRDDLYAAYAATSGAPVDADAVHWWEVMSNVKWGVMTIVQAFTHLWGHVRSLELAAIGRRTVETEYDVLALLN